MTHPDPAKEGLSQKAWPAITLEIVGREDGGLRITSPNILGLIMSHADREALFRDLPLVIDKLIEMNGYQAASPSRVREEAIEECAKAIEEYRKDDPETVLSAALRFNFAFRIRSLKSKGHGQ